MISTYLGEVANVGLSDGRPDWVLDHTYQKLSESRADQANVDEAMDGLFLGLGFQRRSSSDEEWDGLVGRCLSHPLNGLLHQDPFTCRAFEKPRGYAGDAELIDLIYGRQKRLPPDGVTELGRKIFDYTTRAPAARGVRARRRVVAELVDQLAERVRQPHILSIAAGHLREVSISEAMRRGLIGRYVALDADAESLHEVDRCYSRFGVETVPASIRGLLTGKLDLGRFDLAYATGLFDYLQQTTGRRLTSRMFDMLRPGGQLLVANFLPGIRDAGYMESYMAWKLLYRAREEMLDLTTGIAQAEIGDVQIFAEENQNIIFLLVTKR